VSHNLSLQTKIRETRGHHWQKVLSSIIWPRENRGLINKVNMNLWENIQEGWKVGNTNFFRYCIFTAHLKNTQNHFKACDCFLQVDLHYLKKCLKYYLQLIIGISVKYRKLWYTYAINSFAHIFKPWKSPHLPYLSVKIVIFSSEGNSPSSDSFFSELNEKNAFKPGW